MNTYLVFGAAGHIGREVVRNLTLGGHKVIATVRSHQFPKEEFDPNFNTEGVSIRLLDDVSDRREVQYLADDIDAKSIDGIIYAVGHLPIYGYPDAISAPLSRMSVSKYANEMNMHQMGVFNVYQCMLKCVKNGGSFLFLSSAITAYKGKFPIYLQAHYHASVISALDWLIEGMRHDPEVVKRTINIHRLAPTAVDTPFYNRGPRPQTKISVQKVVDEILLALKSETQVDKALY